MINGNNNKIKAAILFNNYNNINGIKRNFNKKNNIISKIKIIKSSNNKIKNKLIIQNEKISLTKSKKFFPRLSIKNIGTNTSKNSEKCQLINNIDNSFITSIKAKSKVNRENFDSSSSLYRNFFVGYNEK